MPCLQIPLNGSAPAAATGGWAAAAGAGAGRHPAEGDARYSKLTSCRGRPRQNGTCPPSRPTRARSSGPQNAPQRRFSRRLAGYGQSCCLPTADVARLQALVGRVAFGVNFCNENTLHIIVEVVGAANLRRHGGQPEAHGLAGGAALAGVPCCVSLEAIWASFLAPMVTSTVFRSPSRMIANEAVLPATSPATRRVSSCESRPRGRLSARITSPWRNPAARPGCPAPRWRRSRPSARECPARSPSRASNSGFARRASRGPRGRGLQARPPRP